MFNCLKGRQILIKPCFNFVSLILNGRAQQVLRITGNDALGDQVRNDSQYGNDDNYNRQNDRQQFCFDGHKIFFVHACVNLISKALYE